jgi:hypothetical protein
MLDGDVVATAVAAGKFGKAGVPGAWPIRRS